MAALWADPSQEITIMKSRQVRISEFAVNWTLWQLDTVNHLGALYVLPSKQDAADFRDVRFKDTVKDSEYLTGIVGETDNKNHLTIRDSHLLFRGTRGEMSGRSMPADVLVFDEYNFIDFNQEDAMSASMDASKYKRRLNLSTPTLPDFGIDAKYKATDARKWYITCDACGHEQVLKFDTNVRERQTKKPVLEAGAKEGQSAFYFGCANCAEELNREHGEWKATNPEGQGRGYHITQLMAKWKTADELAWSYANALKRGRLAKFYQEKLGEPYKDATVAVSDDDFLSYGYPMLDGHQGGGLVGGVDWGEHESWIVVLKDEEMPLKPGDDVTELKDKLVYLERITAPGELGHAKRVAEIMTRFNLDALVADFGYGADKNKYLEDRFQGRFWKCVYADGHKTYEPTWKDEDNIVNVNRTLSLQTTLSQIKGRKLALPVKDDTVRLLISHTSAIHKVTETNAKGQEVERFESTGADHFGHALNYAQVAKDRLAHQPGIHMI